MILDKSVTKNFFGRENLLEILYRTVSSAKNGGAGSILLSGKRGVGKTKLLANLYNLIFERQEGVRPFFYTVRKSFASAEDFADDYLVSFILQGLAFQRKDSALLSGVYSLEDLREGAKEFGAQWVVDIINDYMKVREEGGELKIFLNAVSAPYRSYQITGVPVLVMIDNMHNVRELCERKGSKLNLGFWTPFAASIRSLHVPHIFSGLPHEIERAFFEDALSGDHLEMIDLPGLNRKDSIKLFTSLCEMYGLKVELEPADFVGTFGGNPLYIKNFLQAARQTGNILSKDVFQRAYYNEITTGMTYKYWTFLLKKYVQQLDLRKPSLGFLYSLCGDNKDDPSSDTAELPLLEQNVVEHIMELLHDSGSIETGFSETRPVDGVLEDIIKRLYQKEVLNESSDMVRESMVVNESAQVKESGTASFIITVPAGPKAGLVVIKSFEQIAKNHNIPLKSMQKLQLAMADLFSNVLAGDASVENFKLKVKCTENSFSVEITTPQRDLVLTEQDSSRIGAYLDDLKVENIEDGTIITLA